MQVRRSLLVVAAVVAVAFAIVTYVRLANRPEPLREAGLKALRSIVSGDARTLMRYVNEQERGEGNVNEETLQALLERLFRPSIEGFVAEGGPEVQEMVTGLLLVQQFVHSDGRTVTLNLTIVESIDGPVLERCVFDILQASLAASWPPEPERRPPAVHGIAATLRSAREALPTLNALPMRGMIVPLSDRGLTFQTWDEYISHLERLDGLVKAGSPASG